MLLNSIKAYIGGELDLPQVQEELDIPATPENCSFRVDEDFRTAFPHVSKVVEEELDILATLENCYSESMETPGQFFLLLKASHERKDIA